jgi:hypothetical protein
LPRVGLRFGRIADLDVVVDAAADLQRRAGQLRQVDFDTVGVAVGVGAKGQGRGVLAPYGLLRVIEAQGAKAVDDRSRHAHFSGPVGAAIAVLDACAAQAQPDGPRIATNSPGLAVIRADLAIRAQTADTSLASTLHVKRGTALLVMERSSYFADGRCCDRTTFFIRPERYAFVLSGVFKSGPAK